MAQSPVRAAHSQLASAAGSELPISPFHVDPGDEIPVGVQLDWRLRSLIASGRLGPGDRLPSVRELASWAGVNVNTVRSVYAGLESRGVIAAQHGSGTFVTSHGLSPELERIATQAIAQAKELGATARDLAMVAFVCADIGSAETGATETVLPAPDASDIEERAVRDELRRQIGRLEALLASHTRDLPAAGPGRDRALGHLADSEQLERTRDELLVRLADSREAAERRGTRERRAKQLREEMLVDPASHRWEVVSDAEMGEEGCRDYSVTAGPLGSLMSWWRLKVSGGCPLAGSA